MLTIKQNKTVQLPELLDYVKKNDIRNETFKSKRGVDYHFDNQQRLSTDLAPKSNETFDIVEDVEINKDTKLDNLMIVKHKVGMPSNDINSKQISSADNASIKDIVGSKLIEKSFKTISIYMLTNEGYFIKIYDVEEDEDYSSLYPKIWHQNNKLLI